MDTTCILVYSKYSKHCSQLMQLIDSAQIPWEKVAKFVPLCIDNDVIRKRVLSSSKVTVHLVPTILVLNSNGLIEKFEADKAFEWASDIASRINMQLLQENAPQMQSVQRSQIHPQIRPQQKQQKQTAPPPHPKKPKGKSNATSIDDIVFEADNEAEDIQESYEFNQNESEDEDPPTPPSVQKKKKRPPVSLRTDANNYEQLGDFGEEEDAIKTVRSAIKTESENSSGGSKGGIMAMAQAMQKSREREDVTTSQNRKKHPV